MHEILIRTKETKAVSVTSCKEVSHELGGDI